MAGYHYLLNYLQNEGFTFNEDNDQISFKYQRFVFSAFKNELQFLQIVAPCITSNVSRDKLLDICNELNDEFFIIKFSMIREDCCWCSYEFIPTEQTSNEDFEMALDSLYKAGCKLLSSINQCNS